MGLCSFARARFEAPRNTIFESFSQPAETLPSRVTVPRASLANGHPLKQRLADPVGLQVAEALGGLEKIVESPLSPCTKRLMKEPVGLIVADEVTDKRLIAIALRATGSASKARVERDIHSVFPKLLAAS
jgi:hypothetical protein